MRIQQSWKKNKIWINSIKDVLSRTIRYELINENVKDEDFSILIQHAVIGVVYQTDISSVYSWISSKSNINKVISRQLSLDISDANLDLSGSYSYYRYFRDDSGGVSEMRRGLISIKDEGAYISFGHRPADARSLDGYDDTGMCFVSDDRLYMLGFRDGNIRLGIAKVPKDPRYDPFLGMVLSTSTKNDHMIFSSFFVMFHSRNKKSEYELKKKDIEEIYNKYLGNNMETGFSFVKNPADTV